MRLIQGVQFIAALMVLWLKEKEVKCSWLGQVQSLNVAKTQGKVPKVHVKWANRMMTVHNKRGKSFLGSCRVESLSRDKVSPCNEQVVCLL
ncbi:hypothetical protein GDO81_010883 [Engystomops pustulosus]|uniref:Uncharacterized protein n=1 Tax=Engystomops pustulosus TaxID=76066 RepID=A0AAV7C3B5_ENGPU|nr:hypothetical protein GDO81_010883 [Engystomops pustulosus]